MEARCLLHSNDHLQTLHKWGVLDLHWHSRAASGLAFPFHHLTCFQQSKQRLPPFPGTPSHLSGVATTYREWHCGDCHGACGRFEGPLLAGMGRCFLRRMGNRPMICSCWGGAAPRCLSATTTRVLGALWKICLPRGTDMRPEAAASEHPGRGVGSWPWMSPGLVVVAGHCCHRWYQFQVPGQHACFQQPPERPSGLN